jgi:pimeloyl-ACP methyl ester carboxylesterase
MVDIVRGDSVKTLYPGCAAGSCCARRPLPAGRPAAPAAPAQTRSCHLPGAEEALRCLTAAGRARLRQTRPAEAARDGRPGLREGARPDPLFVLAGGPGQAGSDVLMLLAGAFKRVRATRDIVFIDQRGTGLSGKLDCKSAEPRHDERRQIEAELRAASPPARRRCRLHHGDAARDIEQVRRRSATARSTSGAAPTAPAWARPMRAPIRTACVR